MMMMMMMMIIIIIIKYVPVTGPVVAQSLGRGIALLIQEHGTRRR